MSKVGPSGILDGILAPYGTSVGATPPSPLPSIPFAATPVRRKLTPWWRDYLDKNPWLPPITTAPLTWDEAPLILKAEFYHWALSLFGQVYSFSLDLREDVEEAAKRQRKACDWLNRRINYRLEKALHRKVMLLCVWEEKGEHRRRLHVHGEFVITDNEVPAAREALRLAGGVWRRARQYQVDHDEDPDEGWLTYISKAVWAASPSLRKRLGNRYLTDYADCPVYARQEVAKIARELFEASRWELLKVRKAAKH